MKPGFVKLKKDDKEVLMPNLMLLDFDIYLLMEDTRKLSAKIREEEDRDKRNEMGEAVQDSMIKTIKALISEYDEYKEFSKGFSMIEHMKVLVSIQKGIKKAEIEQMVQSDFLVENDERDITGDSENFLSQKE